MEVLNSPNLFVIQIEMDIYSMVKKVSGLEMVGLASLSHLSPSTSFPCFQS